MPKWPQSSPHDGPAFLIDHDDAEREFAYPSTAATFQQTESIATVAERLGWTVVSLGTGFLVSARG